MTTQSANQEKPLFGLGRTMATPGAMVVMQGMGLSPISLLSRHQRGDWGELAEEDKAANDEAVTKSDRIFSSYRFGTVIFWVITEADRSLTTILLPEEY